MSSRSHKIRAGLFAIVAAALAAAAILAFGGMLFLRDGDAYYVEYEGTVYGLEDGANVYMSGVRVGSVDEIKVSPDDPSRVRVRIVVRDGTPVRTDTLAMLQFTGITGLKVIDLRGGTPGAPALPPGSQIAAGETVLDKLEKRAEELADQTTLLMERTNKILANVVAITDPESELMQTARRGAEELALAGTALREIAAENRATIRRSLAGVERLTTGAERLTTGADEVVAQLKDVLRENSASLRATMFDLRQASRNIKELATEVRQRPSRLLFSGTPRDRRLP